MSVMPVVRFAALAALTGLTATLACAQISIPTVLVGNAGNPADPATGFGAVPYLYRITTTEITCGQYVAFLNAKARSDPNGLFNTEMAGQFGNIIRRGSPGSYTYEVDFNRDDTPINHITFWSACRFANWMHNGQGNGDTETGVYTLTPARIAANTVTRNAGWRWAVVSENEWYKAAYYQPAAQGGDVDGYWRYPTSSNALPSMSQANFGRGAFDPCVDPFPLAPARSYAPNFYGAFDLGGNLSEWNETAVGADTRCHRGGSFIRSGDSLRADQREGISPNIDSYAHGFRLAQAVLPPTCPADIVSIGGSPSPDGLVTGDDFNAFIAAFAAADGLADIVSIGGTPPSDGLITGDDFNAFIGSFAAGCP